jgi:hypothetical protein
VEGLTSDQEEHKPATVDNSVKAYFVQDNRIVRTGELAESIRKPRSTFKVQVEEIEDEYWINDAKMSKARHGIIEEMDPKDAGDAVEGRAEERNPLQNIPEWAEDNPKRTALEPVEGEELDPPPQELGPIVLRPKRNPRPGNSAIGVSALAVQGWVVSIKEGCVIIRLDSGVDISLISEDFYNQLKNPPPIREGHKMSLAQLTDKGTVIRGYTKLKILMMTLSDELIETEAEVYVVKGMSVPILLSEDYQINYEIGVSRNVETGTRISFRSLPYEVAATGIEAFAGRAEVHQLAAELTVFSSKFTKAKEHRRAKV